MLKAAVHIWSGLGLSCSSSSQFPLEEWKTPFIDFSMKKYDVLLGFILMWLLILKGRAIISSLKKKCYVFKEKKNSGN